MPRRSRVDSASEAVKIMQGANKQIDAPSNVRMSPEDKAFFASIIDEQARAHWTAHQLELAALLARDMADLEQAQDDLRKEGETVIKVNGDIGVNPLRRIISILSNDIVSKRRSLGIHSNAKGGDIREVAKRRQIAKDTENSFEDELLSRPN